MIDGTRSRFTCPPAAPLQSTAPQHQAGNAGTGALIARKEPAGHWRFAYSTRKSLFEPHTDMIVKGFRNVQYGHKINLISEVRGFINALTIEEGNPGDGTLFLPVLDYHRSVLGEPPCSVVADGGYASQANVTARRAMGLKHDAFHKPAPENDQKDTWKDHAMHAGGLNLD